MEDLLDIATYDGMKELLEDEFPSFLELFFSENQEALDKMQAGLQSNDADSIRAAAHNIKSSSGYIGATKLSALASDIEAKAIAGSTDNIHAMYSEAKSVFETLKANLS